MSNTIKKQILTRQLTDDRQYWMNRLSGEIVKSYFPYDFYHSTGKVKESENTHPVDSNMAHVKFKWSGEIFQRLIRLSSQSNPQLHMILLAGLMILLAKYTAEQDITVGIPIDRQEIEGRPLNTILPIRAALTPGMTFKEMLLKVRSIINEAVEHQNYPIEDLVKGMNLESSPDSFPLFDVCLLLENIQDKSYIDHLPMHIIFTFSRTDQALEGVVEYCADTYYSGTIQRIIEYFEKALHQGIFDVNIPIEDIQLLTETERQQLVDYNNTAATYPETKTIHELFEQQVEKSPESEALICQQRFTTYRELNNSANRVARALRKKGATSGTIVGIHKENSPEMVMAIMGVLKAGSTYLPLDTELPEPRKLYMFQDSGIMILLTGKDSPQLPNWDGQVLTIENILGEIFPVDNLEPTSKPTDPAYIIYTSGSTGKPKGVMIEHRTLINYICWADKIYLRGEKAAFPLYTSIAFDLTVTSIFLPLISGNKIIIYGGSVKNFLLEKVLQENQVDVIKLTPGHLKTIGHEMVVNSNIRRLIVGGEQLETHLARKISEIFPHQIQIYNEYGPTEATVGCMIYQFDPGRNFHGAVPIGVPGGNAHIYLLDQNKKPLPMGCIGEIYIGGHNLARGYVNRVELTAEKFINYIIKNLTGDTPERLYSSGDLARLLPDGNMLYIGRKDQQVKIRGYRIEIGEIENSLLTYEGIKEAVVLAKQEKEDNYLVAYIVPTSYQNSIISSSPLLGLASSLDISALREYLMNHLPSYMIPSFFIQLDKIPLTANGKLDRKALPELMPGNQGRTLAPPRTKLEKELVEIWAETLNINKNQIGIDTNFFEVGGNSIKATQLVSRIHEKFNARIQLSKIFNAPLIKDLAEILIDSVGEKFSSINPIEKKEYYKLSSAQKRLFLLHEIDPGSLAYNASEIVRIEGELDKAKIEWAALQLIARHESFRTSFGVIEDNPIQRVHEKVEFKIRQYAIEASLPEATEKAIKSFVKPFDLAQPPLIRMGLIQQEEKSFILIIDMHHIISDGVSAEIFLREFMTLYIEKELPRLRLRYKDYSEWHNNWVESTEFKNQEQYWLNRFSGVIPTLNIPLNYSRPKVRSFEGDMVKMLIEGDLIFKLEQLMNTTVTTLYMVLLAVCNILLYKYTGQEDIIIGSVTTGRSHIELESIIGFFINMHAMRNRIDGEQLFVQFIEEVKKNTLDALDNQDYPFDELVSKLGIKRESNRYPLVDMVFQLQPVPLQQKMLPFRISPYQYRHGLAKFDLYFFAYEIQNAISINIQYATSLFTRTAVENMAKNYLHILTQVLDNDNIRLEQIKILQEESMAASNPLQDDLGDFGF